jgi:hypothetical protein
MHEILQILSLTLGLSPFCHPLSASRHPPEKGTVPFSGPLFRASV